MHKQSFHSGVVYTLLSAFGMALIGLFGKLGASMFSLGALIFWRFLAAFLICLLALGVMRKWRSVFSIGRWKLHLMRAVFVLGAQYSFYYYVQRGSLMNGLALLSLGPLTIPFIEKLLTGHAIGKSTWVSLVVSFIGVLCILQPSGGVFSVLSLVGVLAGLSQGCSQVVLGLSNKTERVEQSLLSLFFICLLLSLIPYFIFDFPAKMQIQHHGYAVGIILFLGLASVLNQFARSIAYKHGTPARLSSFLYFAILLGLLFDWLFFNQRPGALSLFGAFLVIVGGVLKVYLRSIILKRK